MLFSMLFDGVWLSGNKRITYLLTYLLIWTVSVGLQYMHDRFIRAAFWQLTERGHRITDEEINYPFYANRLVGLPRLRQLRVRDDTCPFSLPGAVKSITDTCTGHYSQLTHSDESYGNVPGYATSAWPSSSSSSFNLPIKSNSEITLCSIKRTTLFTTITHIFWSIFL